MLLSATWQLRSAAKTGECLKQRDVQLCEYSSPLRDGDVCLNSLRLGTELWESAPLFHFSCYRKATGIQKYSTMPVVYMGYYRKGIGIVTVHCKRQCPQNVWGRKELFSYVELVYYSQMRTVHLRWVDLRIQLSVSWQQLYFGSSKVLL